MYKRNIDLSLTASQSCFLWGPRQTGKSTLLKNTFPDALYYDLLLASDFRRLLQNPSILREEIEARSLTRATQTTPVIIDESNREIKCSALPSGAKSKGSASGPSHASTSPGGLRSALAILVGCVPMSCSPI